jgi:hypothetical protein
MQEKALESWREMNSELTGFNPIVLEFWKRVFFSSDEFVDLLVVKLAPEMLLFLRKMAEVEVLKGLMSVLIAAPLLWPKF